MHRYFLKSLRRMLFGLTRKLTLALSGVILLCAGAVFSISIFVQKQLIEDRLNLSAVHLAALIKEVSVPAILRNDPASLETFFEKLEARTDVTSVALVNPRGKLWMAAKAGIEDRYSPVDDPFLEMAIASGQPQQVLRERYLHRAGPIEYAGETIGFLNLRVARAPIAEELRSLWISIAAIGLVCVIVGLVIARLVARRLSQPLLDLETASRRVAEGDFSHRVESDSNDEFDLVAASFNNMLDELRSALLEAKRVAYQDKLTGIPNRSWLSLQLENLTSPRNKENGFAILFLDVDKFKDVNDTFGHHIGDILLREFANRVLSCLRGLGLNPTGFRIDKDQSPDFRAGEAVISRLGGDEFTIFVDCKHANRLAHSITMAMRNAFQLEDTSLTVSTSIGIAHYPEHALTREHLLKCADVAMYQAKHSARGTFAVYNIEKHEELQTRNQLEKDVRQAVCNDEFELFLQPKFNIVTDQIVGAEALIRWNHPQRGYVRPVEFLPVATSMGLMPRIGELMICKAIRAAAYINSGRRSTITMAVNASGEELLATGFAERLQDQLDRTGLNPRLVEVEITEGTAMERDDQVGHNLKLLRDIGVSLAIDDFGVGYSNLSRLKNLSFDTLKIDRSLILDVPADNAAAQLLQTVLNMASVLGADVVCEGVETMEQLTFLREQGVKTYQGYLRARPMPLNDFLKWVCITEIEKPLPSPRLKMVS